MDSIADYFTAFPQQSDPDFNLAISAKQEFREIAHEGFTRGLFNNQEFVVRMMSPGTGMKRLFMDSYMGTGKTRPPYIIMEMYKDIMKEKPLIILPGDAIDTAHYSEIRQLYGDLTTNEINKRYEFVHYTSFANHVSSLIGTEKGREKVRQEYGNRVIFGDEIHYLRDVKNGKETYKVLNEFFHMVMESSVTILATGTSKMDSAAEIAMVNLLLEEDRQINIDEIMEVVDNTTDATFQDMVEYFKPYFTGIMFYINLDPSTMPPMRMKGEVWDIPDIGSTFEPIVTHVMRPYQDQVYSNIEYDVQHKVRGRNIHSLSYALSFVFPKYGDRDPISFTDYAVSYLGDSSSSSIGKFMDDDEAIRKWSVGMNDIEKVKDYSIKYGDLLEDILATPLRHRFLYFPYVEMGIVIFGILLEKQGYRYYNGTNPLIPTEGNKAKRYSVIYEKTTPSRMANIVSAANMVENKYGEYLHVVLGSPKSGVGISFINARAMDMTRGTWHKGQEDQARSRVFRATSLQHFNKKDTEEYNIIVGRHATISKNNRFTKDVEMFFVSDIKTEKIVYTGKAQMELAMNTYISAYRNKNIPDPIYANLPIDYTSWVLGGYSYDMEREIESTIKILFTHHNSLRADDLGGEGGFPPYVIQKVLGDMVDQNILVRDRWGRQMFVKNDGDGEYFLQDGYTSGSQQVMRPEYQVANKNWYERDTSIFSYIRPSILRDSFLKFIRQTKGMDEDDFVHAYLDLFIEIKIVSLEMLLVKGQGKGIPKSRRKLILSTMKNNWFIIPGMKCVVHILDQINIDRVHYTANVSNIENTGKLRIYCYDDESPSWRFVTDEEAPPIIEYINQARKENEAYYSSRSNIYGIVNTTDNNFRIYDASDKEGGGKNISATGYICMDKKKQAMLPLLWKFQIQPPPEVVEANKPKKGITDLKNADDVTEVTMRKAIALANASASTIPKGMSKKEATRFYFYWLNSSMKNDICPSIRAYFKRNDLLFIK